MKTLKYIAMGTAMMALASCHNGSQEFPDYDVQTIYFANQSPVLTVTLGEDSDNTDNTLDNEHKFEVYVTLGGINTNKKDRWAEVAVDNSLVNGVTFSDNGQPVMALPSNYYTIENTRVIIKKGNIMGAVTVDLADAYFQDPLASTVNYVLPLRIIQASDSIRQGVAAEGVVSPNVVNSGDWDVAPENYTLYGVKFKNNWAGSWLSRGTVTKNENGKVTTVEHKNQYWEKEEIHYLNSRTLNTCTYDMANVASITKADGSIGEVSLPVQLMLTFSDNSGITVSSLTDGATATGSGTYTYHGAVKAWGDKDRDLIDLNFSYSIPYVVNEITGETATLKVDVKESMCTQSRMNKFETFSFNFN